MAAAVLIALVTLGFTKALIVLAIVLAVFLRIWAGAAFGSARCRFRHPIWLRDQ